MEMTLGEIARRLGAACEGDAATPITGVASLADAMPGDISFLASPKYAQFMTSTRASAVVVGPDFAGGCTCALIRCADPDHGFAIVADMVGLPDPVLPEGIHASAVIAEDAEIAPDARIGACCVIAAGARVGPGVEIWPGCYVGHDSVIGANSKLYPNVTVRERVSVGARVTLHSGCVIGSDGFGYVNVDGQWKKIRQVGTVVVEDDVEVGACVTIDRARFGKTVIGRGSKLDNLIQIGHNVQVGSHCAFAAQVGIAGSAKIGNHVQMGGQAGASGHLEVGDYSVVAARGGVTKDVPPRTFVSGFPAAPHNQAKRLHASIARLPQLREKIKDLEKRLARLEGSGANQVEE